MKRLIRYILSRLLETPGEYFRRAPHERVWIGPCGQMVVNPESIRSLAQRHAVAQSNAPGSAEATVRETQESSDV